MKRSSRINLAILGTLALIAGCGANPEENVDVRQNSYASLEDCLRDWGGDERNCQAESDNRHTNAGGGTHWGPRYYWNHHGGFPVAINNDGSTRPLPSSYVTNQHAASTLARSTSFSTASITHGSISRSGFGRTGSVHFSSGA